MIKINLAKKLKGGGSGGFDLSSLFPFLSSMGGKAGKKSNFDWKKSSVVRAAIAGVIVFLVDEMLADQKKQELQKVDAQISAVEKQVSSVQEKLNKFKGYDQAKQQLDNDENSVRTKLETLTTLFERRGSPAKMLLKITQALPEEVWLTSFNVSHDQAKLVGSTYGFTYVSDFLRALTDSTYFQDINLSGIRETGSGEQERAMQNFEINARVRKAL